MRFQCRSIVGRDAKIKNQTPAHALQNAGNRSNSQRESDSAQTKHTKKFSIKHFGTPNSPPPHQSFFVFGVFLCFEEKEAPT